jgi:hypothetical protein
MRQSAIARGAIPPSRKGKKHTIKTRLLMSKAKTTHGLTPLRQLIRNCLEMRQWRSDIFHRDGFTCVLCGAKSCKGVNVYIEADHYPKTFASIFNEYKISSLEEAINCAEMWDLNNGRTLCKSCHLQVSHPHVI